MEAATKLNLVSVAGPLVSKIELFVESSEGSCLGGFG